MTLKWPFVISVQIQCDTSLRRLNGHKQSKSKGGIFISSWYDYRDSSWHYDSQVTLRESSMKSMWHHCGVSTVIVIIMTKKWHLYFITLWLSGDSSCLRVKSSWRILNYLHLVLMRHIDSRPNGTGVIVLPSKIKSNKQNFCLLLKKLNAFLNWKEILHFPFIIY